MPLEPHWNYSSQMDACSNSNRFILLLNSDHSPSGGGDEIILLDGLGRLQVDSSLGHHTRSLRRIWSYHPFVPPPLHIFNKEENTIVSKEIGVEER